MSVFFGAAAAVITSFSPAPAWAIDLQFTPVTSERSVVDIRNAGDGSDRLFLVTRSGEIIILKDGAELQTPFLDIEDRVRTGGSEQGLLSMAFPPDFTASGAFYVWYTDLSGDQVLSRFSVTGNPDITDAGSEEILLTVPQPFSNHNGGRLAFGPDGMLYLGIGDGGSANDPQDNGQALDTLLGKLIRIDVDPSLSPYGIPPDNPFINNGAALDEIWAIGLRNPWRMSFDRETGDLFIADVGQNEVEEVDHQPASSTGGENYGWRIMEGDQCFIPSNCSADGLTLPVAAYNHDEGCSITGGEVYRGTEYPDLVGIYLYGDFCTGTVWGLSHNGNSWQTQELADSGFNILTFGEDEAGNIYLSSGTEIYLISDGDPVQEPTVNINAGMNDAWVSDDAPFQGFFFTVFEGSLLFFMSWFTFDSVEPGPGAEPAVFGANDHRWVTGAGFYSGNSVTISVELTSGGIFNDSVPAATQAPGYGTITITFKSCSEAVLTYSFPSAGLSGEMTLRRVLPDNAALCDLLNQG